MQPRPLAKVEQKSPSCEIPKICSGLTFGFNQNRIITKGLRNPNRTLNIVSNSSNRFHDQVRCKVSQKLDSGKWHLPANRIDLWTIKQLCKVMTSLRSFTVYLLPIGNPERNVTDNLIQYAPMLCFIDPPAGAPEHQLGGGLKFGGGHSHKL